MLRISSAHSDGSGIPRPDFDIDVAHPGIKRAGTGIPGARVGRRASAPSGEEDQVILVVWILVARMFSPSTNTGRRAPYPISRMAGHHVQRSREPVTPFGDEDHAFARGLLHLVDGLLNGGAIVGDAVRGGSETVFRQIYGLAIVQADGIVGGCRSRGRGEQQGEDQQGPGSHGIILIADGIIMRLRLYGKKCPASAARNRRRPPAGGRA